MSNLRVAVLVPPGNPSAPADQADTFVQAQQISQCLTILGNESLTIVFGDDRDLVDRDLLAVRPDVVVNLIEDLPEGPEFAFVATELLDRLKIPYTGASTAALRALGDKRDMKLRLVAAGLPVPANLDGHAASAIRPPDADVQRYIVKSAVEHASIGIDATSVVVGTAAARTLLAERHASRAGTWFAEAFVDGREFNLAIIETAAGPHPLPVAEILFLDHADRPKILGYDEKWADASAAHAATPRSFALAPSDASLHAELTRLGLAAWRLFGLRGYARVDFRVDERGTPYILEVNANPCLSADAGFCAAGREAGLTQTDIVAHLIEAALA